MTRARTAFADFKNRIGYKKWKSIKYLLMALPFILYVFAFSYVPLFGWAYAFCDYRVGQRWNVFDFVGLKHFIRLFADPNVGRVLRNTLVMGFLNIVISPLPVLMAILLNDIKNSKVKRFVQTFTTFPNFISWIVIFGLAHSIFNGTGLWNQFLELLHLPTNQFGLIGDVRHTWVFMLLLGCWQGLGWNTIIYMAAIAGIDTELYDAARVDGANKVQSIWHVTVPGVLPTYMVMLLLSVSNLLSSGFEQFYMFWNSLVADKIEVLDYYVYKMSFGTGQYSYSIAVGMVKTIVSIALLLTVNWISKETRGDSLI